VKEKKKVSVHVQDSPTFYRIQQSTFINIQWLLLMLLLRFMTAIPTSIQNSTEKTLFLTYLLL